MILKSSIDKDVKILVIFKISKKKVVEENNKISTLYFYFIFIDNMIRYMIWKFSFQQSILKTILNWSLKFLSNKKQFSIYIYTLYKYLNRLFSIQKKTKRNQLIIIRCIYFVTFYLYLFILSFIYLKYSYKNHLMLCYCPIEQIKNSIMPFVRNRQAHSCHYWQFSFFFFSISWLVIADHINPSVGNLSIYKRMNR